MYVLRLENRSPKRAAVYKVLQDDHEEEGRPCPAELGRENRKRSLKSQGARIQVGRKEDFLTIRS